jgi:hypothetical protein
MINRASVPVCGNCSCVQVLGLRLKEALRKNPSNAENVVSNTKQIRKNLVPL